MGIGKVISLDDTIEKMKLDYLYNGNERYLKFIKRLYSIDYNKWSLYFWELYIVKLFEEEIRERLSYIKDINKIAKEIANDIKVERERIIIFNYVQGAVLGYKSLRLNKEITKICEKILNERKSKKIHISEIMRNKYIRVYNELLAREIREANAQNQIDETLIMYCNDKIYDKLTKYNLNYDLNAVQSEIYFILKKDCLEKYKEGVWDGVISRVVKDIDKKYRIIL
ncbi:hypothetical protein SAMN05661008_00103 [Alkalithermobacter thermoalcaliphilus JW-YL-7 = DSM 7308]|uniref:Uncharacterized protein n=1 Tax=Alkalithermobacter thermoalcaliphilus JW-YL-7 = DSM 7308 TaxID=1121328 RepID=A0A150FRU8_CLOPD|nr:hypothetical protein JWYL7_1418 [[Clostridium] paradoxum JW-YL-7 = DSM 7308]SHK37072.1 hypothetical protein SAMN05661008_00103 [[Clostridium] paradoxum JW-YL-7 = DSM 7308]